MFRRLSVLLIFSIVFSLVAIALPTSIAAARTFTFAAQSVGWSVTVTMCTNGFTVNAVGSTPVGAMTSVRVVEADQLLPNDKPPFIRLTRKLEISSGSGSMLVAMAGNPKVTASGTANFYFAERVGVGAPVQTTLEGYVNGNPLNINGTGVDIAKNCTVPPPAPFINDLSGVIVDLNAAKVNSLALDGRASPTSGDLMVIYCISSGQFAGNIVVNGVDPAGNPPYRLGQFSYNAVTGARGKAISIPAMDNRGEIAVSMPKNGVFLAEWTNGSFGSYISKVFTCRMDKTKFNKTADQLKYPDAYGNDGRVEPNPADVMAVYCIVSKSQIKIVGISRDSQGYDLATFKYTDVRAAAPNPVVQNVPGQGTVALQVDFDDNFTLKWSGGPWGGDQWKAFKCRF